MKLSLPSYNPFVLFHLVVTGSADWCANWAEGFFITKRAHWVTRLMNAYNGLEPLTPFWSFAAGVLAFILLPLLCIHLNALPEPR